jgi:hypothetical protein
MFARKYVDRVEQLQLAIAKSLIEGVAEQHKVQPLHVSALAPGVCHSHNPCRSVQDGCAYCQRRGNVFVAGPGEALPAPDL